MARICATLCHPAVERALEASALSSAARRASLACIEFRPDVFAWFIVMGL